MPATSMRMGFPMKTGPRLPLQRTPATPRLSCSSTRRLPAISGAGRGSCRTLACASTMMARGMTRLWGVGSGRHQAPRPIQPPEAGALSGRSRSGLVPVHRVRRAHRGSSRHAAPALRRAVLPRSIRTCRSRMWRTMDDTLPACWRGWRSSRRSVSSFGVLAVLLAIVGVDGMMSWSVAERRREIAIRLCARRLREELWTWRWRRVVALGRPWDSAAACSFAPLAAQALTGLLYGIRPNRPRPRWPEPPSRLRSSRSWAAIVPVRPGASARIEPRR